MKIVLTGHQGFVGHHIGAALIAQGHDVVGVDDMRTGVKLAGDGYWAEYVTNFQRADLRGADALVHCAAYADVSRNWDSRDERVKLWSNNVDATLVLMENARNAGVQRALFISTLAVLGPEISPYAATKIAGEALVQCYVPKWHILRLASVMGEGYHHGHVSDFVRLSKDGGIRARSSGIPKRSCVHVADVADAVCTEIVRDEPSILSLSSGLWSPRDTVRVMGCDATWAEEDYGWKGDVAPIAPTTGSRSVEDGVRDALTSLGWPVTAAALPSSSSDAAISRTGS